MLPSFLCRGIYCALLFLAMALYLFAPNTYSPQHLFVTLILVVGTLAIWGMRTEDCPFLNDRAFRPSIIFLIGFVVVHFQLYVDLLLGNYQAGDYWLGPASAFNRSASLALAGLIAFFLGQTVRIKPSNEPFRRQEHYSLVPSVLLCVGALILFLGTVNWSFFDGGHIARMTAGNEDAAMGTIGRYTDVIMRASLLVPLFFYLRNIFSLRQFNPRALPRNIWEFSKGLGPIYLSVFGAYSFLMLLSGRRSVPVALVLLYLFAYFAATKKKFSKLSLAIAIFAGGVLMFAVGVVRSEKFYQAPLSEKVSAGVEAVSEMFTGDEGSFCPVTAELAGSVRSLNVVVDQVPNVRPYTYGRMALSSLTSSIPFLNSLLLNGTLYSGMIPGSASYATYIDQGDNPIFGIGSTVVLDFFFDGGIVPVIIGMFLVGVCFRKVEISFWGNGCPSYVWLIVGLTLFSESLFSVRGSFVGIAKTFLYTWVLVKCIKGVSLSTER